MLRGKCERDKNLEILRKAHPSLSKVHNALGDYWTLPPELQTLPENIRPESYKLWMRITEEHKIVGNVTIAANVLKRSKQTWHKNIVFCNLHKMIQVVCATIVFLNTSVRSYLPH